MEVVNSYGKCKDTCKRHLLLSGLYEACKSGQRTHMSDVPVEVISKVSGVLTCD